MDHVATFSTTQFLYSCWRIDLIPVLMESRRRCCGCCSRRVLIISFAITGVFLLVAGLVLDVGGVFSNIIKNKVDQVSSSFLWLFCIDNALRCGKFGLEKPFISVLVGLKFIDTLFEEKSLSFFSLVAFNAQQKLRKENCASAHEIFFWNEVAHVPPLPCFGEILDWFNPKNKILP